MKKIISLLCFTTVLLSLLASCSAKTGAYGPFAPGKNDAPAYDEPAEVNETLNAPPELTEYDVKLKENDFVRTADEPTSTFSADVDTASYAYFRRLVNEGYNMKQLSATAGGNLRTEEMVNYFKYDCPAPDGTLFGIKADVAKTPYGDTALLKLTLQTEKTEPQTKNNLVFLIDVSGSMTSNDKLPLLKKAFGYLVQNLDGDDVVSIVTYSGKEEVVLEGCAGNRHEMILNAVNSLQASGSTNGQAGLVKAYEIAERYRIEGGNNRIFMASDGDLNVGISSPEELKSFVEGKRDAGVFLSVLGFGQGNYRDSNMEAIADNGNGVYMYIDGEAEAEKVFGEDLFANLYTVAKDVKLQITFNPDFVSAYRLIGYENRVLNNKDFLDDTKDAGELGAGHLVTVFYELQFTENLPEGDSDVLASLAIRYKQPDGIKSVEEQFTVTAGDYTDTPDSDFSFAAAVVELSLLLRDSEYKGNADTNVLLARLGAIDKAYIDADPYKAQFIELVETLVRAQG